jgi:hypothetical protein
MTLVLVKTRTELWEERTFTGKRLKAKDIEV